MRYGTYLVPAAIVLTLGSLACKPPKTAEEIKAETQAAFNEGYQAFKDGKARETNPYVTAKDAKEIPHKIQGWYDGWDKAKADKDAADKAAAEKAAAEEAARKAAAEKAAAEEAARRAAEAEKAAAYKRAADAALKTIHFDFDKSEIKEADRALLQGIADFMKAYPAAKVEIEGHCDERGTNEYNLALGNRRAAAALAYLKTLGVDEARFTTISYGKEKPLCTEAKEACWSQNRRGEFKLK
ncbi:peptidoglycan-associated lipoprotein Pal [Geothrix fermentans]|jgi:peptidoglycan-associated lipoprotein|uniref:peptidoglycan-associated lipoprotein Pal n=1 Tax=Geothrix fermentans TaxID=44676 RepID=UPI00040B4084|nr:peptidoglycan-associated lipoprotein Pal [Geothrix fermentans]